MTRLCIRQVTFNELKVAWLKGRNVSLTFLNKTDIVREDAQHVRLGSRDQSIITLGDG